MGQATGIVTAAVQLGLQAIQIRPARMIGPFKAQVTIEEQHTDELEITNQPVEQGYAVTDHAYKRPEQLTVTCGWSNTPSSGNILTGLLGAVTGTINGVASILTGNSQSQVKEVYAKLLDLQKSLVPMKVVTGKRTYENMLIRSLRVTTDKETENSLIVTAVFQQIIIVKTTTLVVGAPADAQASPESTSAPTERGTKSLESGANYNGPAGNAALGGI